VSKNYDHCQQRLSGDTYHHTRRPNKEQTATTCRVHECCGSDGSDQRDGCLPDVKSELLASASNASTGVDEVGVVREESIARVLRNNTKTDQNSQPPSVTACLEEVKVAGALLGLLLHTHGLTDLSVFVLHGGVVGVAGCMVVGEEVEGLLVAVLADEEPG